MTLDCETTKQRPVSHQENPFGLERYEEFVARERKTHALEESKKSLFLRVGGALKGFLRTLAYPNKEPQSLKLEPLAAKKKQALETYVPTLDKKC